MHLRRLQLTNFRSCRSTEIHLDKTLTILAGENNAGKTNVIDALRLVSSPSDARRTRFVGVDDLRLGANSLDIEVEFEGLDPAQCGLFFSALSSNTATDASWQYHWAPPPPGTRRRTPSWTVGPRAQPETEPDIREFIRHVHLPALRDADRDLASSSPGRIEFLLRQLLLGKDEQRDSLLKSASAAFGVVLQEAPLVEAQERVRKAFAPLAEGFQPHEAHLRFAEPTLLGLARDLRFALTEQGVDPAVLGQTGLGYANLLYLSSVLVELETAKDAELTLMLVEEPEAHLHPQLQRAVLSLLERRATESAQLSKPGAHAGQIQVLLTTHSPNLTAATSVRRIVVLRSSRETVTTVAEHALAGVEAPAPPDTENEGASSVGTGERGSSTSALETVAIAVANLNLDAISERKIDRYLDVTKASLLFGARVILVEGVSESLLMPAFASAILNPLELARFRAATVLAIDGVDFEPYVRLLLGGRAGAPRIADRVVVLTDEDPNELGADTDENPEPLVNSVVSTSDAPVTPSPGRARAEQLRAIALELGADDRLHVAVTPETLEASLLSETAPGDTAHQAVKEAFVDCTGLKGRSRREQEWKLRIDQLPIAQRGTAFVKWMKSTGTRKGDLAQRLAAVIERDLQTGKRFPVPQHVATALRVLVGTS